MKCHPSADPGEAGGSDHVVCTTGPVARATLSAPPLGFASRRMRFPLNEIFLALTPSSRSTKLARPPPAPVFPSCQAQEIMAKWFLRRRTARS